jgi:hypothetical protein
VPLMFHTGATIPGTHPHLIVTRMKGQSAERL